MVVGGTERTPPAILEFEPRVNQKSPVSRSAFGFIIFPTPHFRNPYLTKMAISSVLF
jgi:hypothetical protein